MKTNMLTLSLLTGLAMILITGLTSFAAKPTKTTSTNLRDILTENLQYPEKAYNNSCTGYVDVVFKIGEDDQIVFRSASSTCDELTEGIKEQLSNISFKELENHYNQFYSVRITLKIE
ncbi:MAG: hypothetical protein WCI71_10430 [Bacteroidota bacterium]